MIESLVVFIISLVIYFRLTSEIDRLRDIEQECCEEYRRIRNQITRCRADRDFEIFEKMIVKFQRRYRRADAVKSTSRDLRGLLENFKKALVR